MKFNSQICTSVEQSKRLLELGLKKETADMVHQPIGTTPFNVWGQQEIEDDFYPAWSLHRLLMITTSKRKVLLIRCESDLFDVVIRRIEREIKKGDFNKDYLEEKL